MGENIKAKFTVVEREPIKAVFKIDPPSLNYNLLFNKPQINSVELVGNKSLSDLGIIQAITNNINLHNSSQQAHPYIRGLITAEATTRANADTTLQNNINSEATVRTNADTALGNRITQEATTRANADTTLQANITAEANARAAADNSERISRENADITLQTNINNEATTRANADTTLQANIEAEATTRASEDTSIRSSIKDGKLFIQKNGVTVATFSANQAGDTTANIIADTPTWGNITGTLSNQTDLQAALNGKQPNLTSANAGTGISITGSGSNVIISNTQTSAEWGNITGTLSNQTDLQVALNNKVTKNADITGATKCKITYDSKGLVTSGADLIESDIPNLHLSKITDITSTAAEVNYLSGATSNIQGQINLKLNISDVIDNVNTTTSNQALSANMGKELSDRIQNIANIGKYLSNWDSTTGLATTIPQVLPYNFVTGMYFVVSVVAGTGGTNYRPEGSTYTGEPSTTVETEEVKVGDFYIYDGTSWSLLKNTGVNTIFSNIGGSPYDNSNLASALNAKVTGNNAIIGATKTKITYDNKGLVTSGTDLTANDIPNLTLSKITDVTANASEINILDGATLTTTELNYVDGVTSNIQTQLNNKSQVIWRTY